MADISSDTEQLTVQWLQASEWMVCDGFRSDDERPRISHFSNVSLLETGEKTSQPFRGVQ